MKTIVRELNQETFNRVKHSTVKNYSSQITQQDINNLLIECVNDYKKKGYTDEQISNMTFTIDYINHQNEK